MQVSKCLPLRYASDPMKKLVLSAGNLCLFVEMMDGKVVFFFLRIGMRGLNNNRGGHPCILRGGRRGNSLLARGTAHLLELLGEEQNREWQNAILMRQRKVTHRERLLETATEKWKIAGKHAGKPVRRSNSSFCIKARLTVPKLFFCYFYI